MRLLGLPLPEGAIRRRQRDCEKRCEDQVKDGIGPEASPEREGRIGHEPRHQGDGHGEPPFSRTPAERPNHDEQQRDSPSEHDRPEYAVDQRDVWRGRRPKPVYAKG